MYSVVGLLAFLVAPVAGAQNTYQAHQFRLDSCEIVAKRAANAWKYRETNDPYPMQSVTGNSPMSVLHVWAVNYTMHDAGSRDDAIKTSFAKCMDNIDRVYRDDRSGVRTRIEDLQ